MSLRIAMVSACPYPVPQGSQALLRETALALSRLGHDVRLVVYGHGVGDDDSGLPIHRCRNLAHARRTASGPSLAKPVLDAEMVTTLRRVAREHEVDIVHAHNYEGLMVALAADTRPIVYHAHNAMADELPFYFRGNSCARTLGAWLDRTFPRRADMVIAPHRALALYLLSQGCDPDHVAVIPPCLSPDETATPAAVEETPRILYTGNLDAYQNLPLLRDVMGLVREKVPNAELVIATSAPNGARRGFDGWATFEHVEDHAVIREMLRRDAVVACPRVSWSGYPIKLVNAMAAGRPVVACKSAGHPIKNGHDGLLVKDNDAEAFAEGILRLLGDPALRRSIGDAARATILRRHSPVGVAEQIEALYADL